MHTFRCLLLQLEQPERDLVCVFLRRAIEKSLSRFEGILRDWVQTERSLFAEWVLESRNVWPMCRIAK